MAGPVPPVPPVPSADILYSQLEGRCFKGYYKGIHKIWTIEWRTFLIQSMDPDMGVILNDIIRLYDNRIWKGFIPCPPPSLYKIYVQDASANNSFIEGPLYSLRIKNCICFSPPNWILTFKYTDKMGYCIEVVQQL